MNGKHLPEDHTGPELAHSSSQQSVSSDAEPEAQKLLIKKLKHVVNALQHQNEELKQENEEQVRTLELQVSQLLREKENYKSIIHGLRGCVDQTSNVLSRSKARFIRLQDQLMDTRHSLTVSQLEMDSPDEVMSINELYRENEELRNTVTFIHSQLDLRPPSRSRSPSRLKASSLDGTTGTELLVLENKDLREKVALAEKKLRASQTVKRRYEQALERANSILDQRVAPSAPEMESRIRELERERNGFKQECSRLAESERTAIDECERVHGICHQLQELLDTTTNALAEQTRISDLSSSRITELEGHIEQVMQECNMLRSQADPQIPQQPQTQSPIPVATALDAESKQYAELVSRLETQFNNSQRQLESVTAEKQRIEGSYRAAQAECAELRNTLSRYETATRDIRSQLSDREGRVQALESAKSLLSTAMFKTEQENKQLLWQLKAVQGADERLAKTQEQLHQLQAQAIDQTRELKVLRETAAQANHYEEAHRLVSQEGIRLHEALKISREESNRLLDEVHTLQDQARHLVQERSIIFAELGRMSMTCNELANLVT